MNEMFWANYGRLTDPEVAMPELISVLKAAGDFSDDILHAMKRELSDRNWSALTRLVHVLFLCPSPKFTPFLCYLLDNHREEGYMEAIADTLIDTPDKRAVASISRAMDYRVPPDDDSHFNRKLIQALRRIGTEDAITVIRRVAESGSSLVRDDAQEALREIGRS